MISMKRLVRKAVALLTFTAGMLAAAVGFSQAMLYPGELGPGDTKLGKYFDTYTLQLSSGDRVVATLGSVDFDAYLLFESPNGTELENDDYAEGNDARLDVIVDTPGIWKVKVTSYEEGEQGKYLLSVNRERLRELESFSGVLDPGDRTSIKGEHYERYPVQVAAGQRILVTMMSEEFDSFLVLKPPRGRRMISDDYLNDLESRIDFIAETDGMYELYATSYEGGEVGVYSLRVMLGEPAKVEQIGGYLDEGDQELDEYGYFDLHSLYLNSGDHLIVEMISERIDTLLRIEGPGGYYEENDDYNEQTFISRIELFAAAEGEYNITAASYEVGVAGSYTLKICSF